jgi:xylulose-5-phosphate/fructose-6-phosphate phosphoketolase
VFRVWARVPPIPKQFIRDELLDHKKYVHRYGEDMPEIRNWKWDHGRIIRQGRTDAGPLIEGL